MSTPNRSDQKSAGSDNKPNSHYDGHSTDADTFGIPLGPRLRHRSSHITPQARTASSGRGNDDVVTMPEDDHKPAKSGYTPSRELVLA